MISLTDYGLIDIFIGAAGALLALIFFLLYLIFR
jgi:hypothetical protein